MEPTREKNEIASGTTVVGGTAGLKLLERVTLNGILEETECKENELKMVKR